MYYIQKLILSGTHCYHEDNFCADLDALACIACLQVADFCLYDYPLDSLKLLLQADVMGVLTPRAFCVLLLGLLALFISKKNYVVFFNLIQKLMPLFLFNGGKIFLKRALGSVLSIISMHVL